MKSGQVSSLPATMKCWLYCIEGKQLHNTCKDIIILEEGNTNPSSNDEFNSFTDNNLNPFSTDITASVPAITIIMINITTVGHCPTSNSNSSALTVNLSSIQIITVTNDSLRSRPTATVLTLLVPIMSKIKKKVHMQRPDVTNLFLDSPPFYSNRIRAGVCRETSLRCGLNLLFFANLGNKGVISTVGMYCIYLRRLVSDVLDVWGTFKVRICIRA